MGREVNPRELSGVSPHLNGAIWVGKYPAHSGREFSDISGRHQESGLTVGDEIHESSNAAGYDEGPGRHRLEHDPPEAFGQGRKDQYPSSPLPQDLVRDARRFGLTSFLEKLLSYLNSPFFVVFLIAALGAAKDVAFFTVAAEFTMRVASTLSVPFSGITLPLFSAVDARKDPRQSASVLRLYVMLMILLFIPMAALLTSVAPFLLPLVYGIRYSEAVPILQLFVPLLFLEYTMYPALRAALMTRGRYKQVLIAKLPLLVGVPAVGLAIPRWGAAGAVVAFGATRVLSAAWLLWTGIRQLHFRFPVTFATKVLLASVGATVPVLIVGRRLSAGWFSLALLLALGVGFLSRSLPGVRRDGR